MSSKTPRQTAEFVIKTLTDAGHTALLAGGCVRDLLLSLPSKDFDVATDARPQRIAELFKRTRLVGAQFGVALVRLFGHDIEVATFRTDGTYSDGRRPDEVFFSTPLEDARRRDFTINGMFYDVQRDCVIDYVGGRDDLEKGIVRAIGEPDRRFAEDYLRMLRAVRFAARFQFEIDAQTQAAIIRESASIGRITPERIREELDKILSDSHRGRGFGLLASTGLISHLWKRHTLTPDLAARAQRLLTLLPPHADADLGTAAMLEGLPSPAAVDVCLQLASSNKRQGLVGWLLESLPRVLSPDDLAPADLKGLMACPGFSRLVDLLEAWSKANDRDLAPHRALVERIRSIAPDEVSPPPLLTGHSLLQLGVPPGPIYAEILKTVYRAQLNGLIPDADAALTMAKRLMRERT